MSVPDEVRSAALAALHAGRKGALVLDLVRDSFLEPRPDGANGSARRLVFGTGDPVVTVDVAYAERPGELTTLTVWVAPPRPIEVEVLAPTPALHHVDAGVPPVSTRTSTPGPASVCVTDGASRRVWQTAWVTL